MQNKHNTIPFLTGKWMINEMSFFGMNTVNEIDFLIYRFKHTELLTKL